MNRPLLEFKLRCAKKAMGELTYSELVTLAQETADTLTHLSVDDVAWITFVKLLREYWKYAELIALLDNLPNKKHLDTVTYLCAWETGYGLNVKHWTEECVFDIPKYNRSTYERETFMAQAIRERFKVLVAHTEIEFIQI